VILNPKADNDALSSPTPSAPDGRNSVPTFSLAHLTLIGCSAPELIYIAARCGYDAVSPRFIPMHVTDKFACEAEDMKMVQATKAALDNTGMKVGELELIRILDNMKPRFCEPAMALAAEMGAQRMITSVWLSEPVDRNYIVDCYVELCDIAAQYGLTVDLEFPTFSTLRTLRAAADIVRAAERPNGGILIDMIYSEFSQLDPAELDSLPPEWFHFLHIADVPNELPTSRKGEIEIARGARLYPGEGRIDFSAIIERLPPLTYSIELPNLKRVEQYGYEGHARRCLEAAKQTLLETRNTENGA
jgi:sugar phosphate isomerase/epimerase